MNTLTLGHVSNFNVAVYIHYEFEILGTTGDL